MISRQFTGRGVLIRAVLAVTAVLVVATLVARAQPVTSMPRLVLSVGAPYVAVVAAIVVAVALWRRRSVLAIGTAALVAVALV